MIFTRRMNTQFDVSIDVLVVESIDHLHEGLEDVVVLDVVFVGILQLLDADIVVVVFVSVLNSYSLDSDAVVILWCRRRLFRVTLFLCSRDAVGKVLFKN